MSPNFRVNNNAVRNLLAPWIDGKPRWSYEFFTRHFARRHQQTIFVILSRERPDLSERGSKDLSANAKGFKLGKNRAVATLTDQIQTYLTVFRL